MILKDNKSRNLEGKVTLVTGASRGIGFAIALLFAKAGSDIAIGYLNSENDALMLKKEIEAMGRKVILCKADVSNEKDVKKMMNCVYNDFSKIDILINSAGVNRSKYLIKTLEDDFDYVIDVNLKGTFLCMKAALKYMIKDNSGCIINISSMIGSYPEVNSGVYAVSKAGVIALSKAASKEYVEQGIRVNVLNPGMVETDMTANAYTPENKEKFIQTIPLRRLATTEDIANCSLMIALSDYLNGEVFELDGGLI